VLRYFIGFTKKFLPSFGLPFEEDEFGLPFEEDEFGLLFEEAGEFGPLPYPLAPLFEEVGETGKDGKLPLLIMFAQEFLGLARDFFLGSLEEEALD